MACKPDPAVTTPDPVPDRSRISGVLVEMDVDGVKFLFVRLGADGSIQRLGGSERDILSGTANPELFGRVVQRITPQLLRWRGQAWSDPAPRGKVCLLVVGFQEADGKESLMRWEYGSESHEPPPEVLDFVVSTVDATTPWFGEQRERVRTRRRRPRAAGWHLIPLWPA